MCIWRNNKSLLQKLTGKWLLENGGLTPAKSEPSIFLEFFPDGLIKYDNRVTAFFLKGRVICLNDGDIFREGCSTIVIRLVNKKQLILQLISDSGESMNKYKLRFTKHFHPPKTT